MWFDVALQCGICSMVDKFGTSKNYKKEKTGTFPYSVP